jgi:hypothetical protein
MQDPLLDRFMPVYDNAERHHIRVAAPAEITFTTACKTDLQQSPIARAIFRAREESLFRTETRVLATDARARAKFRRYWSLVSPGIIAIRWVMLQPVKREAEREALCLRSR